jgi:UDP-glucuronate decarboxylase
MKKILVTGANGFVGRHTLKPLLKKNYQVHALSSSGKIIEDHPEVIWHFLNLHDHDSVKNLMHKVRPTHLLHLAWYAKPNEYWMSPLNLEWLKSSIELLNHFKSVEGERAVFAGSCAEYNWQHQHCHENLTPCVPQSFYGSAKYSLYLLANSLAKQNSLSFAWGRLFFLFGPHEYPERIMPAAIQHFLNNKLFNIKNKNQIRDYLFVKDAADALVSLLDSSVTGAVNVASGQSYKMGELITKIAEKMQQTSSLQFESNSTTDILTADVTRLFNEVNWRPNYSLDEAFDATIEFWCRAAMINVPP